MEKVKVTAFEYALWQAWHDQDPSNNNIDKYEPETEQERQQAIEKKLLEQASKMRILKPSPKS